MRVVFDTNVLVSALIFPEGRAEAALLRVLEGRDRLLVSRPLIDELLSVLSRKFGRDREQLARAAVFLSEAAELVRSKRGVQILKDEADNRVLECAVAGRADMIVTGDKAMLRLGRYREVGIVSLRAYLGLG